MKTARNELIHRTFYCSLFLRSNEKSTAKIGNAINLNDLYMWHYAVGMCTRVCAVLNLYRNVTSHRTLIDTYRVINYIKLKSMQQNSIQQGSLDHL